MSATLPPLGRLAPTARTVESPQACLEDFAAASKDLSEWPEGPYYLETWQLTRSGKTGKVVRMVRVG